MTVGEGAVLDGRYRLGPPLGRGGDQSKVQLEIHYTALDFSAPELVRSYVRDLYKYEIRRLRDRYVSGEFPKVEYANRVDSLRRSYPELARLPHEFVEP